ncbi:SWIM zinc finger family protein [Hymenobacter saemangeumensis]|uniref:SWIM zinc finger family protein n=1 Tax=Hymenobacter saemangeumensis TaxID=1084522 RepID=A0ABP8IM31_9BACT
MAWTEEQVRALVTDAGTLKRGQELASPSKWSNLGQTDTAAWGHCAGSGSRPYLTAIDLSEPAFKCSCPSRVFPCKHGAGLFLLLAGQPELLPTAAPPDWLADWLGKRQQSQEKKTSKAAAPVPAEEAEDTPTTRPTAPADAGPGLEVAPARLARMEQGAADLELWLIDLMRSGIAALDQQPRSFWESQAARLVDNQLPGLAGTLRELATLRHSHADWPARLLGRLGELYWLTRAFRNRHHLPADTHQEVLQQVGITIKKEELLTQAPAITDEWQVLGLRITEEERLTVRRCWLRGLGTGRYALLLEYAFGSQPFATHLVPNAYYEGRLVFYPGLLPLRATPLELKFTGSGKAHAAPPGLSPTQLLQGYAEALARHPWLREWPATLAEVVPARLPDDSWVLTHGPENLALPLRLSSADEGWQLLALSGGHPLSVFGEWDGQALRPLGSWSYL